MDELIARLETTTGADRELDAAIYGATAGGNWSWQKAIEHRKATNADWFPLYTKSVDDALKLMPWAWMAGCAPEGKFFCEAQESMDEFGHSTKEASGHGANPAIAICIAALKARAHSLLG